MLRKLRERAAGADITPTSAGAPVTDVLAGLKNFGLIVLGILSAGMGIKGFLQSGA